MRSTWSRATRGVGVFMRRLSGRPRSVVKESRNVSTPVFTNVTGIRECRNSASALADNGFPGSAIQEAEVFDVVTTGELNGAAAAPLLEGLLEEYSARYGAGAVREFDRHPAEQFAAANGGAVVLLVEDGRTVAGGALRAFDPAYAAEGVLEADFPAQRTTEFKRIWTHAQYRRRGLGRRVLAELEHRATELGYQRVFLTTGPRQPEAVALYLAAGYTELPDAGAEARGFALHPFIKTLHN